MKTMKQYLLIALVCLPAWNSRAANWYVATNGTDVSAGTNWVTAKATIQAAIDVAVSNDTVLVSNGVYATGGRVVYGAMINRVAINKPITVRSVNGPADTVIEGAGPMGDSAVRCVYLGAGAVLSGFTLTNGATRASGNSYLEQSGGGAWCEVSGLLTNCTLTGNSAKYGGGGSYQGKLNNCTLSGNSAYYYGGGVYAGILSNCTLSGNTASIGGGVYYGWLSYCTISSNSAAWNSGGGASGDDSVRVTLNNCMIANNSDGGVAFGNLNNCVISGNSGGGAAASTLDTCVLTGNSNYEGGGANGSTLNHCTITDNSAYIGGGVSGCTLHSCIVYYNTALHGPNYDFRWAGSAYYCCTMPNPGGIGNTTNEPLLASASHLSAGSPCIGRGSYSGGLDIDGEFWASPPAIGCDEYRSGAVTGSLSVAIVVAYTNVSVGFPVPFNAAIAGRTTASSWNFGDGTIISNHPYISQAWSNAGVYPVVLTTYNESHPQGVASTVRVAVVDQPVHYVRANNPAPIAPYSSWATAASNIQDAIDAVISAGALVLVSNGVYEIGGRVIPVGVTTNRIVINNGVTVRSVNGPTMTLIKGAGPAGDAAVRCVYLAHDAVLSGFTLTNGFASDGGGVWSECFGIASNCIFAGNNAHDNGGGAYGGTLYNCTLSGNTAVWEDGGGAADGMLYNCTISGNTAEYGGGASCFIISNCVINSNSGYYGGGVCGYHRPVTIYDCIISGNSAQYGGGAEGGTLYNCTLSGNNSDSYGGGAEGSTLYNCTLSGNSASFGGGAYESALYNCTLTGNSAVNGEGGKGGGAHNCDLYNCIVYYNLAAEGPNIYGTNANYCCTMPNPGGTCNITDDPLLASASHLSSGSPCIGQGSVSYTKGVDIDGETWAYPPAIGCDEYRAGSVTGNLSVAIVSVYTNVSVDWPVPFTALIAGRTTASSWNFGDGTMISNQPYISHAWSNTGVFPIVLTTWNESRLQGMAATAWVTVVRSVHYVRANNPAPIAPYFSWATAAANIQDAIDSVSTVGALVLVSNGVYNNGGGGYDGTYFQSNRVLINKPIIVRSVNGPLVTVICGASNPITPHGNASVRCVSMLTNSFLSGFTLTNGFTRYNIYTYFHGGGVFAKQGCIISNCIITGNHTLNHGGGVWGGGTIYNSTLIGNTAGGGGGVSGPTTLYNCTITKNSSGYLNGGGVGVESILYNCIVYNNWAASGTCSNYWAGSGIDGTFNYSCTAPMPAGTGNISADPLFVDNAAGNYRLQSNSPCINRGVNQTWMLGVADLDGNPRIAYGIVDMGAYEAQFPIGYWAWVGAITNGLTNYTDSATDDGYPNLLKYVTGSSPTNPDDLAQLNGTISNGLPVLIFNRNTNAMDATVIVQGALTISNGTLWTGLATNRNGSWGGALNVVESGSGNPVACIVQDTASSPTNRFLRLKVARP